MCFKSSSHSIEIPQEKIEIKQANAAATKNNQKEFSSNYRENFKTTPIGLTDFANTQKHTLLGD